MWLESESRDNELVWEPFVIISSRESYESFNDCNIECIIVHIPIAPVLPLPRLLFSAACVRGPNPCQQDVQLAPHSSWTIQLEAKAWGRGLTLDLRCKSMAT